MKDSKKLFRISGYVTPSGLKWTIKEYEYKETKSSYILNAESNFGGKTTRISKLDIGKIDSMVRENPESIHKYTYCFKPDLLDNAKKILSILTTVAIKYKKSVDDMVEYLHAAGKKIELTF